MWRGILLPVCSSTQIQLHGMSATGRRSNTTKPGCTSSAERRCPASINVDAVAIIAPNPSIDRLETLGQISRGGAWLASQGAAGTGVQPRRAELHLPDRRRNEQAAMGARAERGRVSEVVQLRPHALACHSPARDAGGHGQAPCQAREAADAEEAVGTVLVGHPVGGCDCVVRGIEPGRRAGREAATGRGRD